MIQKEKDTYQFYMELNNQINSNAEDIRKNAGDELADYLDKRILNK